jgi:Ion channel
MQKPNGKKAVPALPIDRRSKVKEAGDVLLKGLTDFNTLDGVEEEFLYITPKNLRAIADVFEKQVKTWNQERRLRASEISVACGIFRKARLAAENRRFLELADRLGMKESRWKTKLHWRNRSYGTALLLSLFGITTGYGTSFTRWLILIVVIIIGFAYLARNDLDYGTKTQSFLNAVYWSVITISTVGYGDITPKENTRTEFIGAIEAIIGLVMFIVLGMLIGEKVRRT